MENFLGSVLFLTVLCLTINGAVSTAPLRNIFCEPRSTVVHTGAHLYPYFVALHRCSGSVAHRSPRLVACLPAVEQDVKVMTHDRVRHVRGSVLMKNHTQCKQECVAKEADCHKPSIFSDCRCQCPHKERPKNVNCGPIKSWSMFKCGCVCNKEEHCSRRMEFDEKTCSCKCKESRKVACKREGGVFKPHTCGCGGRRGAKSTKEQGLLENSQPFWISVFFAEFIIMMLIFETILYYKNHGCVYALSKRWSKKQPRPVHTDLGKDNAHQMSSDNVYVSTGDILVYTEGLTPKN